MKKFEKSIIVATFLDYSIADEDQFDIEICNTIEEVKENIGKKDIILVKLNTEMANGLEANEIHYIAYINLSELEAAKKDPAKLIFLSNNKFRLVQIGITEAMYPYAFKLKLDAIIKSEEDKKELNSLLENLKE